MNNHLALLSVVWAAAVLLSSSGDALSITNDVVSSRRVAWNKKKLSSLPHHRMIASSLNLSSLPDNNHNDKINVGRIDDADICSSAPFMGRNKQSTLEMNFNTLFGRKEMFQNFLSNEQQRSINLNQALCAAAMSVVIGMQPLSTLAYDSNNGVTSDGLNYQQGAVISTTTSINYDAIKSSSMLAATSSELRVKIDDTINSKTPPQVSSSSSSSNSKLRMGVKMEYYPEEIEEMKLQAEREELERKARVEKEMMDVQQQQQKLAAREREMLEEKRIMEEKMVKEKAAKLAASTAATSTATTKAIAKELSSPPPSVQIAENTLQNSQQTPQSKNINTEKEELIKMLRDTSTTSAITKQRLPFQSQVATTKPIQNNDNIDVVVSEGDETQLPLIQLVGVGAVGAGLFNSVTSKKESENNDNTSDENNIGKPRLPSSPSSTLTTTTPSSPLVKYTPTPPTEPPISPSDTRLNQVLGLLEDDLQELNKNLELLENDLYELNEDLDLLQDQDEDSNLALVGGGGASDATGSYRSYLDSLAGSGQFELKRSGTGFQSSYLGRLGDAAPIEFDYNDSTAAMEEEDTSNYDDNVDQMSHASSDVDQYENNGAEELPLPPLDSYSPNQSSTSPSVGGADAAIVSRGSYLDSLAGSGQFELKRYGTGFQSPYLGRLGGAVPLEFKDDSTAAVEEGETANYDNFDATSNASSDVDQHESNEAEDLAPIDIPSASTVAKGSYLDSLTDGNPTEARGSYLDLLSSATQRSGTGFQSSYIGGLGGAAPLEFDYNDSTAAVEEEYAANYDNVDATSNASSDVDQYENNDAEDLAPIVIPADATVSKGSYLDSLTDGNPTEARGSYLDSLASANQRSGTGFQSSYIGGLGGAAPLEFDYIDSTAAMEEDDTANYGNVDQMSNASPDVDQYANNEAEELPSTPPPSTSSEQSSTLPAVGGAASAATGSYRSYLDSLAGSGQFELKRSGTGFQSSYLGRMRGAAPLEFDYNDFTAAMEEDDTANYSTVDQTLNASPDVDQYADNEAEELPSTPPLSDTEQSSTLPSVGGADATSSIRSYLESLAGSGQFELKRSGAGFQSSYLGRLGGAAPMEFDYNDSTAAMEEEDTANYDDNVEQISYASPDVDHYANNEAEELPSTHPPSPSSEQSSTLPSVGGASDAVSSIRSYLESLAGSGQFELKRSGAGFQSSYLGRLGDAAPLEFDHDDSTTAMEEENTSNYDDNVDATSNASSDVDQYQDNETEELPSTSPPSTSSNQSPTPPWSEGADAATVSRGSYLNSLAASIQFESKRYGTGFQSVYLGGLGGAAPLEFNYDDSTAAMEEEYAANYDDNVDATSNASSDVDQYENNEAEDLGPVDILSASTVSKGSYLDSLTDDNPTEARGSYLDSLASANERSGMGFQSSYLGGLGGYLDTLVGSSKFDSKPSGTAIDSQISYLGGLKVASTPLEFRYVGSTATLEEQYTANYDNVDQTTHAPSSEDQHEINEAEEPSPPSPPSLSSSGGTFPTSANAQRRIIATTSSGRKLSIAARIANDFNVDRGISPPFRGQSSSTRLQMFGITHRRGRQPTRLYMSQQPEEEEPMFPSTNALVEILRQQKMEKDRRDAELRAQQQQQQAEREAQEAAALKARHEEEERKLAEQKAKHEEEERILAEQQAKQEAEWFAAEEQRAIEEAEQRAREQEERLLAEQRAKEDAALEMQLQMRMMAAEKKAEEERMMEQFLMEQRAKEEEAEKLRQQQQEVERLAEERRQREEEEAKLRAWEEEEERLLLEEKVKEEAEMKVFEERLAAEQRAQRAKEEAELRKIEQNMSYLNDALAQVDDRLDALNSNESEEEVEYLDVDDGIKYLNSAVAEIDDLLSEGDTL